MVVSSSADIYSPFHQQHIMPAEDGPQSSEEGSGLHSPVFGAPYGSAGDSLRYPDIHPQSLAAPYSDYPLMETGARQPHVTFPAHTHYPLPPRNQLGIDFTVQPPVATRMPPTPHIDFRYSPTTERRLPGGSSHETYNRPAGPSTMPMEQHRSEPAPPQEPSSSAREPRKEISSVVIACRQCRSRKIRCDSTRPNCNNCVRRSNTCEYDSVPKRRGPDKRPGTRQRSCKKRPADGSVPPPSKRKRTTNTTERPAEQRELPPSRVKENLQHDTKRLSPTATREPYPPSPTDLRMPSDQQDYKTDMTSSYRRPQYNVYEQGPYPKQSYPRQLDVNTFQFPETPHRHPAPTSPTIDAEHRQWWNRIERHHQLADIVSEFQFLVQNTGHLLSFINMDHFAKKLFGDDRYRIQPCFILSGLAMAKLMKSSSLEEGQVGLQQAIILANDAHTAFQEVLRLNWIDHTVAEAALILALFESSAYPQHSPGRATEALTMLDRIITQLSLTTWDRHDRDVALFSPDHVPTIICDSGQDDYPAHDRKCSCIPPGALDHPDRYKSRPYILPWGDTWTMDEVRAEEIRRLCWSSLTLIAEYVARCEAFNEQAPQFSLCDPAKFALLFPGEVIDRISPAFRASDSLSVKESVWALYCRSMLLWTFCNRFHTPSQDEDRAEQAHEAFMEVQSIEDALNAHRCNLDTTLIYNTREYIHNTRMLVALALRSFHGLDNGKQHGHGPVFKRKQAEDWLFYEDQVIRRVNNIINALHTSSGHQLTRRPYRINWFINQLQICLVLWHHDPSLDDALKLGKSILHPIDVLNALWPCPTIQTRCDALRQQLIEACLTRGIEPPSYMPTLPHFLRQQ